MRLKVMRNSTSTLRQSTTVVWWFPYLPGRENVPPKGQDPIPEDYPDLLAARIQELADAETPKRQQELAEDAGLSVKDMGTHMVEQSILEEEVVSGLVDGRRGLRG